MRRLPKFWDSHPLHTTIVEILEKKGDLIDDELYKALKSSHDDLSFRAFNKTLMKLEVDGIIRVFDLTKNKRRIELIKV